MCELQTEQNQKQQSPSEIHDAIVGCNWAVLTKYKKQVKIKPGTEQSCSKIADIIKQYR
jgi:hypothetical protein